MFDLVVRGGTVVSGTAMGQADIAVEDGVIREVGRELAAGREEIDARGLTIFPGLIDVHLHFNEPGRTEWEGAATGSRALAAGGGTLYFDMPLNSTPCTVDAAAFDAKRAALEKASVTDFGLWGGIVPGNRECLPELAARGVVGFKAFLSDSGLPEFPRADDLTFYEALQVAAAHNLPVSVHAESEEITGRLARRMRDAGRSDVRAFLESRPVVAEVEAIQRAALLARTAGAWLHIVHISSGRGVAAALEARALGTNLTIETCPHYLFFTGEDMERLGAVAKCAPPLRPPDDVEALWQRLLHDEIDMIASDHSPSSPELKTDTDFFRVWGGIAGVQSRLAVLLEGGYHRRGVPLTTLARVAAETPARRFRIAGKGEIAASFDADLTLVDLARATTLTADDLHQRHPQSPYTGYTFRGAVVRTLQRGKTIYFNGAITAASAGRFVRPQLQELS
ncbi:MAG: allantoinase AllB [Candidatus Solibacter sp.]